MRFRHRRAITEPRLVKGDGETISLTSLEEGESGEMAFAYGGCGLVRRLAEMGLTPGVEVKLLRRCPFRGPLQIEVRGVALALGYGIASKVFVKPLRKEPDG